MKIMPLVVAGIVTSAFSACGSMTPTLTFDDQVKIACGAVQGEVMILRSDNVFTGGAADTLTNDIEPAIGKVCAAGATVTSPDLQAVINATLPLIKSVVDASSLPQDKKNAANAAIDTGVLAFNIAINLAPVATSGAAAK